MKACTDKSLPLPTLSSPVYFQRQPVLSASCVSFMHVSSNVYTLSCTSLFHLAIHPICQHLKSFLILLPYSLPEQGWSIIYLTSPLSRTIPHLLLNNHKGVNKTTGYISRCENTMSKACAFVILIDVVWRTYLVISLVHFSNWVVFVLYWFVGALCIWWN